MFIDCLLQLKIKNEKLKTERYVHHTDIMDVKLAGTDNRFVPGG